MLHLIELGESQQAGAKWLLEKAGRKPGQLVAGGGRDTDSGRKKRMRREGRPFATSTYYTISTIFVKVNISVVVSMRWRSDGSTAPSQFGILAPGMFRAPLSRDSLAREAVGSHWDSAGLCIASVLFASSLPLRP